MATEFCPDNLGFASWWALRHPQRWGTDEVRKQWETRHRPMTMALFGSGMSYGHSHGNANLPLVLAGGSDLGLKHGSHLDFNRTAADFKGYALNPEGALTSAHYQLCSRPANTDAHMSNLLLLMAQRMGVETDRHGDSNKVISL